MKEIKEFREENYFLSNFYDTPITYDGLTFKNAESAFQSKKCYTREEQMQFTDLTAASAKRLGKRVLLRTDWEDIKDAIMYEVVLAKFSQNPELKEMLLDTGDAYLEEGNTWKDKYWGTFNGIGRNKLGKILMNIRKELREEKNDDSSINNYYVEVTYTDVSFKSEKIAIVSVHGKKGEWINTYTELAEQKICEKYGLNHDTIVILEYRFLGKNVEFIM